MVAVETKGNEAGEGSFPRERVKTFIASYFPYPALHSSNIRTFGIFNEWKVITLIKWHDSNELTCPCTDQYYTMCITSCNLSRPSYAPLNRLEITEIMKLNALSKVTHLEDKLYSSAEVNCYVVN
jgi:hypothetical protein